MDTTIINPATQEELERMPLMGKQEIEGCVAKAREAFPSWSKVPFIRRSHNIRQARRYILGNIDEIASVISQENGKPLSEALSADIYPVCDLMSYFADNTERLLRSRRLCIGVWDLFLRSSELRFAPVGLVAVISPWNFPFSIPMGEIVMALMAGNCVLHKPSSSALLTGRKIAEIMSAAGLPEGVFTHVPGNASSAQALISARMDKVLFTGSVGVGKEVMAQAAQTLTPVVLELGGKDPMVVCRDADIEVASSAAVWGAFTNAGQVCASVERVYVHASIVEDFISRVVTKTRRLRQGPSLDHDTDIGPLTTERQLDEVISQVEDAKRRGAKILVGGERLKGSSGWFYAPTVMTNIDHTFRIMKEETFGPIMPIMTFQDEDEAVSLANDTPFGLAASVWTKDIRRGTILAGKISAGTVAINECVYTHALCQTPWGGHGASGFGRTHSSLGLMEVVRPQHIHVNRITFLKDFWWYPYSPELYKLLKKLTTRLTTGGLSGLFSSLGTLLRLLLLRKT